MMAEKLNTILAYNLDRDRIEIELRKKLLIRVLNGKHMSQGTLHDDEIERMHITVQHNVDRYNDLKANSDSERKAAADDRSRFEKAIAQIRY